MCGFIRLQIVDVSLRMLSHDPNYKYDSDGDEEEDEMETEDFEEWVFSLFSSPLGLPPPPPHTSPLHINPFLSSTPYEIIYLFNLLFLAVRKTMSTVMMMMWAGRCVEQLPNAWRPCLVPALRCWLTSIELCLQPSSQGSKVSVPGENVYYQSGVILC